MGRMVQITTFLRPEQAAELKALSAQTRVPMASYIREGVDMLLEKYRETLEATTEQSRTPRLGS